MEEANLAGKRMAASVENKLPAVAIFETAKPAVRGFELGPEHRVMFANPNCGVKIARLKSKSRRPLQSQMQRQNPEK